jgi:branched-chain amino acid transport system substrate-binding protein
MKIKATIFSCGMYFFSLFICFVLDVAAEESNSKKSSFLNPFLEAEHLYHSGSFDKAQLFYQNFLNEKPSSSLGNTALYRLGAIHQRNRSFATALRYFKLIIGRAPTLELFHDTNFSLAQCLFELEQYDKAEALFGKIILSHPDAKKKWEAEIYLGKSYEKRLDPERAIEKLWMIYSQSEDKTLHEEAGKLIQLIIENQLHKSTLVRLSKKYSSGFPLDQILLKLISIYRDERNLEQLQRIVFEFLRLFPDSSERFLVESTLKQIEKNKENKLRLGVVLPLTGKMALSGQQVLQGIQLAVSETNLTHKDTSLEIIIKDSASGTIEQTVETLAIDPNVIGIIGPVLSPFVRDSFPIADRYHLSMITPTASSASLAELSPYVFRNVATREYQGKYIAEYAVNTLGLRRFVVLYPSEEFGLKLKDAFIKEVESLGQEVIALIPYDRSQADFKKQIQELGGIDDDQLKKLIKEQVVNNIESEPLGQNDIMSRPFSEMGLWSGDKVENLKVSLELSYDAIFLPGFYDKVGLIIPQLVFYNIEAATLLGSSGWNSTKLIEMTGNYIEKGYFVDGFYAKSKRPEVVRFVRDYNKIFNEAPTILSAQAYDATKMLVKTIRLGARDRIQVRKGLFKIRDFRGVSGRTTILATGEAEKKLFTIKITKNKISEQN